MMIPCKEPLYFCRFSSADFLSAKVHIQGPRCGPLRGAFLQEWRVPGAGCKEGPWERALVAGATVIPQSLSSSLNDAPLLLLIKKTSKELRSPPLFLSPIKTSQKPARTWWSTTSSLPSGASAPLPRAGKGRRVGCRSSSSLAVWSGGAGAEGSS